MTNNDTMQLRVHGLMRRLQLTRSELAKHSVKAFEDLYTWKWCICLTDKGRARACKSAYFWKEVRDYLEP